MPQLPNETCWNLQVACLEIYKGNCNLYSKIWVGKHEIVPANIEQLIDNIGLYREASNFLEQMKTFGAILDKKLGDSYHISDAVHIWYPLITNNDVAHHHGAIKRRFGAAIQPFHFLGYMTEHCYLNEWKASMDPVHQNSAEKWKET